MKNHRIHKLALSLFALSIAIANTQPATADTPSSVQSFESLSIRPREPLRVTRDEAFKSSEWAAFDANRLIGRSMIATIGLGTACMIALWSGRRVRNSRTKVGDAQRSMTIVDSLSLAPRCSLQLVQVDGQKFLIARDTTGVRSITPVNSFSEALADADDFPHTPDTELQRASTVGLSLETPSTTFSREPRRSDPWQGPAWKS